MKRHKTDPESRHFIHLRYQDTAVVIFKEQQREARQQVASPSPSTSRYSTAWEDKPVTDGAGTSASSSTYKYSRYGNEAVIVHKEGKMVTKKDSQNVQSAICIVM